MPTVKDEKGKVVAEMSYDAKGEAQANKMVSENPGYTVVNAMDRSKTMYMHGGMVHDKMYMGGGKVHGKMYKKGGKAKK